MFKYLTGISDWNSEGVPNYLNEYCNDPDPFIIFALNQTFITEHTIDSTLYNSPGNRNIVIQSTDPNFSGATINVTFVNVITNKLDTIGYTMFNIYDGFYDKHTIMDNSNGLRRSITRSDIAADDTSDNPQNIMNRTILFPLCNRENKISYLPRGATITLKPMLPQFAYQGNVLSGKFANNVGIGFFVIPSGWDGTNKVIQTDFNTLNSILYSQDELNINSSTLGYVRQNFTIYDKQHSFSSYTSLLVTFNDDDTTSGDRDFSDVQLQVKIIPPSCIDTTKYITIPPLNKPNYSSFIFDNYGLYYYFFTIDLMNILMHKNVVLKHIIQSSTVDYNNDLYNIFNTIYYNNSASSVDLTDSTSFTITTHINPALIPFDSKTYIVFRMDENTTQPYYNDSTQFNKDYLFTSYAQNSGNVITESINIMLDGVLFKTLTNNGGNRVDLSYYYTVIET